MRFAELDAVTLDAFGTLLTLRAPVEALSHLTGRDEADVRRALEAEIAHYRPRSHNGRDSGSLALLRAECAAVFNQTLGSSLPAEEFVGALEYEPLPGVPESLAALRAQGLSLAVVANWDCALPEHLDRIGLGRFVSTVVTSAEAGAAKPDPRPFLLALERLEVEPGRALHVGDSPEDEEGAAAAGLRFAPAPLTALL
jgi:HAD superfamily hydrolase (TIGR01509 family)